MRKLILLVMLCSIFAFTACNKSDLVPETSQEITTKSAKKVLNFRTHLTGANEVPAVWTEAAGQAIFQLSMDGTELSYKLITDSIENVRMAHIHIAAEGQNGPVAAWLYGPEVIEGVFGGVLAEGVITNADLIGPLAGQSLADLVAIFYAGGAYVNVHTVQNPGGEIRGQIKGNMPNSGK